MLIKYWDDMYSMGHMALFGICSLGFITPANIEQLRCTLYTIKKDSHRDHRAHRGKILGALGVLGGKEYTLSTMKKYMLKVE